LNDTPSDNNISDKVNSNINSVEENNSNDISLPMDCDHECTLYNTLFQTNEDDKYTCERLTRSNHRYPICGLPFFF